MIAVKEVIKSLECEMAVVKLRKDNISHILKDIKNCKDIIKYHVCLIPLWSDDIKTVGVAESFFKAYSIAVDKFAKKNNRRDGEWETDAWVEFEGYPNEIQICCSDFSWYNRTENACRLKFCKDE